jgi:hypothetical protein
VQGGLNEWMGGGRDLQVYGVYRVSYAYQTGQKLKLDLLVMEYLFYRRDIKKIWDLKGSLRNRSVQIPRRACTVLV